MLEEKEIRKIAEGIVKEARRTAKYEQGTLMRSISYTYIRGLLTFRQIFYGVYYENSQLEKLARQRVPRSISYQIVLTDFNRRVVERSRIKKGTASEEGSLTSLIRSGTSGIKALIARNKLKKAKDNGKKKN